jgi:hypothetical protein
MWHRLVGPDWLNVQILPSETKKEITMLYDDYIAKSPIPFIKEHIYSIIDYMNEKDASYQLPRTKEMINVIDNSRNQNLADVVPWLAESINYKKK